MRLPLRSVLLLIAFGLAVLLFVAVGATGLPDWLGNFVFYGALFAVVSGVSVRLGKTLGRPMAAGTIASALLMAVAGTVGGSAQHVLLTAGIVLYLLVWYYARVPIRQRGVS